MLKPATARPEVNVDVRPHPWRGPAIAFVGAAVLTALASVLPAGARKLVLFAVAFGMGTGLIAAYAARHFATPRRVVLTLVPLLTLAGLMFIAHRTWREYQRLQQAADIENRRNAPASAMLEAIAADDPETARMLEREQAATAPGFLQYLAVRTRPLGEWSQPWPLLFWIGELVLACVGGLLVADRMLRIADHIQRPDPVMEEGTKSA